ncbi:DUF202 domain-containing protein [Demequina phytophila]|uniref:DUF202 domain-containing protein n=1 Tax=Demequina phytophila TaxID=1638981 RepID=UPI00078595EB|nr:DUF202 domain-containing protein [Demequina phytophila]
MEAERTFLAWIRTALMLAIAALLLVALDVPVAEVWRLAAAGLLLLLAVTAAAQGLYSWRVHARAAGDEEPPPDLRVARWLVWGVVAAVLLLLVGWVMT